ncbi:MAG: hypothetical protein ACXVHI_06620 [Frankiaceae bacterium]
MAWVPVLSSLFAGFRARSDAIAEMPFGLLKMNESMREMTNAVVSTTDTLEHVQRLVLRVDRLVGDLEEPLRSLAPGLTRLAKVLDDPAVDALPDTLHRLSSDALPLVKGMRETQARMTAIASSTDRISSIVDETGNRLAGLAGLATGGLLRGRRAPSQASQVDPGLADLAPAVGGPGPAGTAGNGHLHTIDLAVDTTISLDDPDEDTAEEQAAWMDAVATAARSRRTHARSA